MAAPIEPSPEAPCRRKRPLGLTVAALACWFVGSHVVAFVPIVILYLLINLCLEEGWSNILLIRPGYLLMLMTGLSIVSTVAWMLAGWDFFRRRSRRGLVRVGLAVGSGLLTGVALAFL